MNSLDFLKVISLASAPILLAKVTLILLVAWISHALLRHSNPGWRILVWRVSAIGVFAIAALSFNGPRFSLPLLPAASSESAATNSATALLRVSPSVEENETSLLSSAVRPSRSDSQPQPARRPRASDSSKSIEPSKDVREFSALSEAEDSPQPVAPRTWSLTRWLLLVWSVGVLLGLFRVLIGLMQVAKLRQNSVAVPDWIDSELAQSVSRGRSAPRIEVRQGANVPAACSVGFFRKTILLPSTLCDKAHAAKIRAILAHEAAHFSGRDLPWNLLLHGLSVLLWFHPLAWRVRLAHADACDERCDAAAANFLRDPTGYGRLLAKIALDLSGRTPTTALPMARVSKIARRIEKLRRGVGFHEMPSWKARTASAVAAALLVFLAAVGVSRSTEVPADGNLGAVAIETAEATEPKQKKEPILSGHILDETGAPVTDATLSLTGNHRKGASFRNSYETKTDEKGYYLFEEIKQADTFRLRIISTKWVGLTSWRNLPQLQLSPKNKMVRDFRLPRACSIRIRTVDEAGNPVRKVRIYSASLADERWSGSSGVSTDQEGWATIGSLKPSTTDYVFGTMDDNYAFAKLIRRLEDPNTQPEEVIVLSKGVDVSGTVLCSDGKPAAGWTITAMPDWWHFGAFPRGAKIAEDGSFTLHHVEKGQHDVTVSVPTSEGMYRQERALSDHDLPPSSGLLEVRLRIPSPQSMTAIAGKVVTSGGDRQQAIQVTAQSEDRQQIYSSSVRPGEQDFRVEPLPPGRYSLTFNSTEVEQKRIPNVQAPSDNLEVDLKVTEKPHLVGTVVRADTAEPLSRFRIRVLKTGYLRGPNYVQDTQWREIENLQGAFSIDVVGPGIYQVVAGADGLAVARSEPINTDEYQGEPIALELSSGVTLRGTVVNEAGQPVDGATVTPLSQSSEPLSEQTQKNANEDGSVKTNQGRFTLHNHPAGKEILKITHPDYSSAMSSEIEIGTEDLETQPIMITKGGTVSGQVFDANGQPQENVTLHIQDQSGRKRFAMVVTDQEGYYEAHQLPEQLCDIVRARQWDDLGVVVAAILPADGESYRLDLGGEQAVTGRLLVNGKALSNTKVQLGGKNPSFAIFKAFAQTDANGAFTFWGPAHGRRYLYYAAPKHRNRWIRAGEVSIEPNTNTLGEINVLSTSLTVTVAGLAEEQAAELRLSLIEYNPIWAHGNDVGTLENRQKLSDPFVFRRVPPGTYELICRRGDSLALRKLIEVKANEGPQETSIEWPSATGTLKVRLDSALCGPGGCNPPNLWSEERSIHASLYSREGKEVQFLQIPAGKYYLADKDTRDAPRVLEFSVAEGETKKLHLTSESYAPKPMRFGFLVVQCSTEQGVPLTGCEVTFGSQGDGIKKHIKKHSDQKGRQTFLGNPGDYTMSVSFPGYETVRRQVSLQQVEPDGRAVGNFKVNIQLALEK